MPLPPPPPSEQDGQGFAPGWVMTAPGAGFGGSDSAVQFGAIPSQVKYVRRGQLAGIFYGRTLSRWQPAEWLCGASAAPSAADRSSLRTGGAGTTVAPSVRKSSALRPRSDPELESSAITSR